MREKLRRAGKIDDQSLDKNTESRVGIIMKTKHLSLFKAGWLLLPMFLLCGFNSACAQERPDFSGTWEMEGWSAEEWDVEPPYTQAGLAAFNTWVADPLADPAHQCIFSLVRITTAPMLHEIMQEEDRVVILYEYDHQVRRVYVDRPHPDDPYPTLMGYSKAVWEDDNSLVIETIGLTEGYLRPQGVPHSDQLRVIEKRTMLKDGNTLTLETIIDDPLYYSKPWSVTTQWKRSDFEIMDYDCIPRPHIGD